MSEHRHHVHGLTVEVPFELEAPPAEGRATDLRFAYGAPVDTSAEPPWLGTEPLARIDHDPISFWSQRAGGGGERYLLRYQHLADLDADLGRGRVVIRPDRRGCDVDLLATLVASDALAHLLAYRGECAIHASAVELEGRAIGIVAPSGGGKTTTAALLCLGGARLVSDDAIRVEAGERVVCHRGSTGLRLRPMGLGAELGLETSPTGDGRHLWAPAVAPEGRIELGALVMPDPSPELRSPRITRVAERDAWMAVLVNPRARGLVDPVALRAHFELSERIAARVPVLRAEIPWSGPEAELGSALAKALGAVTGEMAHTSTNR